MKPFNKIQSSAFKAATLLLVVIFVTSCSSKKTTADKGTSLFNGKDLAGWRFYKGRENNSWEVVDGTLHCKPFDGNEKRADLISDNQYKNFELTWEWKIAPQGNSGIMFDVVEDFDEPYLSGPEYQLLDDIGYPGKIEEWQKSASNYGMHAANGAAPKPVGEWNESTLMVKDGHVEHWLNGKKVVEYELGTPEWKELKSKSKWNEVPGYGASQTGHIAIQDHGSEVWLRNIYIKSL